jgi:predicted ABC-type ATPase
MTSRTPNTVLIGGPNGAGKSTVAPRLVERAFSSIEFVNADVIASGLSGLHPDREAFAAGRIMLQHIHRLAAARRDFAFESTLASRTFAPFLKRLRASEYETHLVYIALRSPDVAVERVRTRVAAGGHAVPEDTIRRRFRRSIINLFDLYLPIVSSWTVLDNSGQAGPTLVASGGIDADIIIADSTLWSALEQHRHER